jgi:hypothetical protein
VSDTASFRRNAAALGLALAAVLAAASRFLYQPHGGNDPAKLLTSLHDAHGRALASTVVFVLYGLPFIIGALGLGHLLRGHFPKLSNVGTSLAVIGAFCDSVASTFTVVYTRMAQDTAHRDAYIDIIKQSTKVEGLFSILGLAGTVLGTLLLSIGLFRSQIGPRWVAPLLWLFLVLEFVGSSITPSIGLASVTVALIAFFGLALTIVRTPTTTWTTGPHTGLPASAAATEQPHTTAV